MANYRVNQLRFHKKVAARSFVLLEKASLEFGYPNSKPCKLSECSKEQLLDWLAELGARLQHLQGFLATCVLHEHKSDEALALLQAVEKLARSWRGKCI
jgi:hypothetical protein